MTHLFQTEPHILWCFMRYCASATVESNAYNDMHVEQGCLPRPADCQNLAGTAMSLTPLRLSFTPASSLLRATVTRKPLRWSGFRENGSPKSRLVLGVGRTRSKSPMVVISKPWVGAHLLQAEAGPRKRPDSSRSTSYRPLPLVVCTYTRCGMLVQDHGQEK